MLCAWCSVEDLSCQYYLREESVGQPRAQACVARLQELNPHVQVRDSSLDMIKDGLHSGCSF